jgi:hypothetical protein
MFPFIHFFLFALFIYKYLFKYFFLICDIFILNILIDFRNFFNFILTFFINKIPSQYGQNYFKVLKKKSPKIYQFIMENQLISFLD